MTQFNFSRALRLLTPADYKQVFDDASLRVSCKELLILARSNRFDHPRLGIVVAKKHVRRATQRNRAKRLIRETFRLHQDDLINRTGTNAAGIGLDAIVLARGGLDRLDNPALRAQLEQLWRQLQKKARKQATG